MTIPTALTIEDGKYEVKKEYFVKFYDGEGHYISTSKDVSFNSFTKSINGGLGELSISLARPFDNFGEEDDIDFLHEIQLWIVDKESGSTGQKIYSGYIDSYEPYANESGEGVKVRAIGFASRLANVIYKNGLDINIVHNTTDPSQMIKSIIERFRAEVTNPKINYTSTSITNTGKSASYTFVLKNCLECIEKARSFAPSDWYWYVDEDNILYFDEKPPRATHTFTFKKDILNISVNKNITDVVNQVLLWNGKTAEESILRSYKDTTSIANYGLRMEQKTDGRWANSATMDLVGQAYRDSRKDINVKVSLDIIDSNGNNLGYDIESINPGDTCQVLNLPTTCTILNDNMKITSVNYTLHRVSLEIEELRQTLSNKFNDLQKALDDQIYNDVDANIYIET